MLDSDLAEIFMFELDDEEVENLSRCKNFTLNMGRGSNIKYKPYVFTEQGVSKYAPIIAILLKNPTLILPH